MCWLLQVDEESLYVAGRYLFQGKKIAFMLKEAHKLTQPLHVVADGVG